jgi:RimJ/RimL family protein N-acetyltransferase
MKSFIYLRELTKGDLKSLVKFRNKKSIWEFIRPKNKSFNTSLKDEKKWFAKANKKNRLNLAIIYNQEYVGNIYFTNIKKSSAEFHIFIGKKSLWGKSIGYRATCIAISIFKNNYNAKKIYLHVTYNNIRAIELYKKCNFSIEKKLNDKYLMIKNLT